MLSAFGAATDLFFYNGVFILTTSVGKIATSVDGFTWTLAANLQTLLLIGDWIFRGIGSGRGFQKLNLLERAQVRGPP